MFIFMLLRKRKILKMIMAEERHLAADLESCKNGTLPEPACKTEVDGHQQRIHELFHKLQPRRPLDWNELFVRLGIAVILFFLMLAPAYPVVRSQYLDPDVITKTSGDGSAVVKYVLPIEPIHADDWQSFKGDDHTDSVEVAASESLAGATLGVVPDAHGAWVYWLEGKMGATVLMRRYVQTPLSPVKGAEVMTDAKWTDGAMLAVPSGIVFAGTRSIFGKNAVTLQRYAPEGKLLGAGSDIFLDEADESMQGIQLFSWKDKLVLLTVRLPKPESTQDRREVVMRVLGTDFSVEKTARLVLGDFHVGLYPSFMGDDEGGFSLIFQGARTVKTSLQVQGDDLYHVHFNDRFEAISGERLTSSGMSHDFWPSSILPDGARFLLAGHQAPRPFDAGRGPSVGYPVNTGKAIVYAFDTSWKRILGSSIVYNEGPFNMPEDLQGATHLRLAKQGKTLYVVYDVMIPDDPETGHPKRAVQIKKVML